jgi:predicted phage terminase large subunit-like protein
MRIPTAAEIEAERARRSLPLFVRLAWSLIEPGTPFLEGFHIDAICEYLEAVVRGEIHKLIINIPPRCGKSSFVSVLFPAWVWTFAPETRWLFASYAQDLASRDSRRCRGIIESPWYKERWGHVYQLAQDANLKHRFENDRTGVRLAAGLAGGITGEGADYIVIDDAHKAEEAQSAAARTAVIEWFSSTISTRRNDPANGAIVIIGQRLHERDLHGHLLQQGGWDHLCLPMEYEPAHQFAWPRDPRTKAGELLWPARFGAEAVEELKRDLLTYGTAGQLQQRPAPAGGGYFKRCWWRYYPDLDALPRPEQLLQSWDLSYDAGQESDYVVGQLWAANGSNKYLIRQRREQMSFPETLAAVREMTDWANQTFPRYRGHAILVERAANGPALIASLRDEIPSLIPIVARDSKTSRAHTISAQVEAGNIWLPGAPNETNTGYDRTLTPAWVEAFIQEFESFPRAAHDDQVDAASQAVQRLTGSGARLRVLTSNPPHRGGLRG